MRVANALATYFIDENLKVREAQASGTSQFLDAELETMRGRLEELESAIKDYRKTYMGELPEQLETNLRVLDRLQENLTDRQEASRAARNRLADLNNQASSRPAPVVVINGDQRTTPTRSLTEMRAELENLKSRYTEQHPDIIRLQKQISEQEAQLKDQKEDNDNSQSTVRIPPELRRQFRDVQEEIHTVDNEIQQIKRQIAEHQQRIENTPKREQELLGLRRDYQNIQTTYDSLLNRKLEADIAVNMERKQKGEQFKIIDPARIPERPVEPDMRKLFAITVFIGLALGAAGAFLPEYVSATYRKADEIESAFGLPVLAEIPSLISPRKMKLTRINNLFSVTGSVVTFSLIGVFGLICLTGSERISSLLRNIFIH
jgi:polysaccharide chain length determinant protein (PEP-CTERM system associated)